MVFTHKTDKGGNTMFSAVRKRLTYANVAMTLALVLAMSGGAYAAGKYVITSAKQIKPSVLKQLQGKAGPAGSAGAPGPAGPQGPAGPAGKDGAPGVEGKQGPLGAEGKEGKEGKAGKAGTTGFTSTLPTGETERGIFAISGQPVEISKTGTSTLRTSISFDIPLEKAPTVHVIAPGTAESEDPAGCSGTVASPQAESGNLCLFESFEENVALLVTSSPETEEESGPGGVLLSAFAAKAGGVTAQGAWAVTG